MPPTGQRGQIIFAAGDYFRRPATGARLCPVPGGISRSKLRQPAPALFTERVCLTRSGNDCNAGVQKNGRQFAK
jgi:hypothetical protein